jgi:hypothetical protein
MDNLLWKFIENFNDTFLREDFKSSKKQKSNKSSDKGSKKKSGKKSEKSSKGGVGAQHHKLSASAKAKYVSAFENTSDNESIFIMLPKNLSLEKNNINILLPNKKKI